MHRALLFHPGRMHRFGRRRMVIDDGGRDRRSAETTLVADQTGADAKVHDSKAHQDRASDAGGMERHAKAEASGKNQRDARRHKVADGGQRERHPGKEAAPAADHAHRDSKVPEARAPEAKAQDVRTEAKGPKAADSRHDDKHPQKRAGADNPPHQAKARSHAAEKSRVAERGDASGKKL
jgi:hypothetical protein